MSAQDLEILKKVFPQLSADVVENLYNVARIVEHPANHLLCTEGQIEGIFYILMEGEVHILKNFEGKKQHLDTKHTGDYFGEMALILNEPRTADVVTAGRTRVVEIDREIFNQYLVANPQITLALTHLTMRHLRRHEEILLTRMAEQKINAPKPHQVFVSYARSDKAFALQIADQIDKQGIKTWVDQRDIAPGDSWPREVGKALDICTLMILVLSPNSIASTNVEDEWNFFLDRKKPIVPIIFQKCDLPFRLLRINYIDFTDTDFNIALSRLLAVLRIHN